MEPCLEKHGSLFDGALTDEVLDSSKRVLSRARGQGGKAFVACNASCLPATLHGSHQKSWHVARIFDTRHLTASWPSR